MTVAAIGSNKRPASGEIDVQRGPKRAKISFPLQHFFVGYPGGTSRLALDIQHLSIVMLHINGAKKGIPFQ